MSSNYFLARHGETTGPLTEADISTLRTAGRLLDYTWIWKPASKHWEALDPAPAAPIFETSAPAPVSHAAQPVAPAARRSVHFDPSGVHALCHDFHQVVQGRLVEATDAGCRLQSAGGTNDAPQLTLRSHVVLQLLEATSGRAMAVNATVRRAGRVDGHWTYDLEWKSCPELIPAVAA